MFTPVSVAHPGRRRFFKLFALGAGLLLLAPKTYAFDDHASQLNLGHKKYRGTYDGRILMSSDNGGSWQQIAQFDKQFTVDKIVAVGNGAVRARLRSKKLRFWVRSKDDIFWLTDNHA